MKRVRNSGGHATVLERKQFERLDSISVAQDNGDLSAFGAVGSLPLRAGLGGGHGSGGRREHGATSRGLHVAGLRFGDVEAAPILGHVAPRLGGLLSHTRLDDFGKAVGVDLWACRGLHLYLRVGPIPTMWPSYPVTSDKSTTVRREVA